MRSPWRFTRHLLTQGDIQLQSSIIDQSNIGGALMRVNDISLFLDRTSEQPLFDQVATAVKSAIRQGRLIPGQKLPTETQLSVDLKVNRSTISRSYDLLRWEGLIDQQRGRGSFVAADAPQRLGVAPRRALKRVALAYAAQNRREIPFPLQFIMLDMLDGVSSVFEPLGIDLCHLPLGNVIESAPERMVHTIRDYDGFVVMTNPGLTERFVEVAHGLGLPSIGIGWGDWPAHTPSVTYNQQQAVRFAAEHLIDQGYRRIGYVGRDDRQITPSKLGAFQQVLGEFGLSLPAKWIHSVPIDTGGAFQLMFQRLKQGLECDALFVDTDYKAIETVNALQAHGYSVPNDVAVMGYDGIHELATFHPQLSTVHVPQRELGVRAADLLLHWLPGRPRPDDVVLSAELVVRTSTPPAPPEEFSTNTWTPTFETND